MCERAHSGKISSTFLPVCLLVMEFYWRVYFVFDWPVLVQYIQVRRDGRTSGQLLFSAQPFVASCVFVLRQCFLIKVFLMKVGETLDCTAGSNWPDTDTHTHEHSILKIPIQGIKRIRHGVKKYKKECNKMRKKTTVSSCFIQRPPTGKGREQESRTM